MIRTFLDANVLINGARGQADNALKVIALLDDPARVFVSASFVELEILPKAICFQNTAEEAFYRAYFERTEKVIIDEPLISRAFNRAARLGLSAVDAIHLEAAITAEAIEFITAEKTSKPFFKEVDINIISLQNM